MHKIKNWAHNAAQEHNYNPWAAANDNTNLGGQNEITNIPVEAEPNSEQPKKPIFRRFLDTFKIIAFHSWMNVLLFFVPAGIAVHFAEINQNIVFALNAIAVIPLAGLLTFATECVAHRLGPTLGALMNVSFGNAVELIIFIIALVKNEIRVVQASLIGSILANLLLILGMALFIGGLEFQEQVYDSVVTQMSAALLCVASLSLLIPTAFHASFSDTAKADAAVLPISRGSSVILLLVYVLYLLFQLKSHSYLYQGVPQHVIDQSTQPGILQRLDSTTTEGSTVSSSTSITSTSTGGSTSVRRRVKKKMRSKLGRRRKTKTEEEVIEEADESKGQSSEGVTTKEKITAEPESLQTSKTEPVTAMNDNQNSNRQPNSPSTNKRPLMSGRGLTIRPPPVFRGQSNIGNMGSNQTPTHQHHYQLPASRLRRLHSTPNMARSGTGDRASTAPSALENPLRSNTGASGGISIGAPSRPTQPIEETSEQPPISQLAAIILLLISTALVAICAEFLVGSINHLVENSALSEAFIGLIILPIVGNAAEHVTAVTVAAKNKLDLSMGVSLGSSIQIALFVTPLIVIIGWILDKEMSLYFTLFETVALFVSVFIVNFLVLDGRSNFLEGALLCACYVIIALGTFYYPDDQDVSALGGGTSSGSAT